MRWKSFLAWSVAALACWLAVGTTGAMGLEPTAVEVPTDSPAALQPPSDLATTTSLLQRLGLKELWSDNNWQWLLLLAAIFLGTLVAWIAAAGLSHVARRFKQRDWPGWAHVVEDLIGPVKLALLTVGLALGLAPLSMSPTLQAFWVKALLLLSSVAVFWYAFNLVSVVEVVLRRVTAMTESTLDDQLVPMIRKALRVALVVVAVVFVVDSVFQRDIFAVLAALGVLGLPLGFAAQDTLKNLFGAIIILFNRPFQVGERILYAGYDGVIEEIGFQTVRVRTLTGHLVTIPNCKIASDAVENVARRPSIRRTMNVTITYDTTREKIEQAVQILRDILEEDGIREPIHPVINGAEYPPRVYFNDYNAESLNVLVLYWYAPPAYWDYLEHAQKLNLRIFEEFEKAGIEFAFPTQTLYVKKDDASNTNTNTNRAAT